MFFKPKTTIFFTHIIDLFMIEDDPKESDDIPDVLVWEVTKVLISVEEEV